MSLGEPALKFHILAPPPGGGGSTGKGYVRSRARQEACSVLGEFSAEVRGRVLSTTGQATRGAGYEVDYECRTWADLLIFIWALFCFLVL